MFSRRIAAISAAVVVLGGAIALAKPASLFTNPVAQVGVEQKDQMNDGWLKDLNLTPDQVQKIKAIRSRNKDNLSQQRQAMQQAQKELKELMAGDASSDQVRQKYDQVKALKQQLGEARFNTLLEIRNVLTLEQRQKFAERMGRMHGGWKDRVRGRGEQS